jgi:hypothetical protein
MVELPVSLGAAVNAVGWSCTAPVDEAGTYGHAAVEAYLRSAGGKSGEELETW